MQTATESKTARDGAICVTLTHDKLSIEAATEKVKSPLAGAVVVFAGTTRNSFDNRPVVRLTYVAYTALALNTLLNIATQVLEKHKLVAISITHRLGEVPVGEESILICLSAPHRTEAWRAGEEALEECKAKAEIWKREEFGDDVSGEGEKVWRANQDAKPTG